MILSVISIICLLFSLYHSGKSFVNVIQGYLALRKIDGYQYPGIKCENMSFSVMPHVISIALDGLLVYCFVKFENYAELLEMTWAMWVFRGLIIVYILTMLVNFSVLFFDKYAYLTYQGMVHITGVMEFNKCRFAWEKSDEELSQYLLVYVEKPNKSFRFRVMENLDKAHKMV